MKKTDGRLKLTNNQVKQLLTKYDTGNYTQTELATRFGLSQQQVSKIVLGQSRWGIN